jgi:hypothetical protein
MAARISLRGDEPQFIAIAVASASARPGWRTSREPSALNFTQLRALQDPCCEELPHHALRMRIHGQKRGFRAKIYFAIDRFALDPSDSIFTFRTLREIKVERVLHRGVARSGADQAAKSIGSILSQRGTA